jgi:hypothetical protein
MGTECLFSIVLTREAKARDGYPAAAQGAFAPERVACRQWEIVFKPPTSTRRNKAFTP